MYALTVKQPWAWAIIHADKDVENRSWSTQHRGPLAIHAGKQPDGKLPEWFNMVDGYNPDDLVFGAIIGIVDVVDCVGDSWSRWAAHGQWHWLLTNPRPLTKPIPCRGFQGLWLADNYRELSALLKPTGGY